MRRPRHKLQISTFPFLAVLLGAMGSLIFLLLVMDRRAKIVARNKIRDAQEARQVSATETERQRQQEWERQRRQLHDMLARQDQQLRSDLQATFGQASKTAQELQAKITTQAQLQAQFDAEQTKLLRERDDLRQRQAALLQNVQVADSSKAELVRLTRDLLDLEQTLDAMKRLKQQQQPTYSLVPYRGQRGANRMPIYVECTDAGLVFLPDGERLAGSDLDLSRIRTEVERRHGPLVKQKRLDPFRPDSESEQPYVLFLIRPDGIGSYYRGQNALRGFQIDFGYELVDADWTLDVPTLQLATPQAPLPAKERSAVSRSPQPLLGQGAKTNIPGALNPNMQAAAAGIAGNQGSVPNMTGSAGNNFGPAMPRAPSAGSVGSAPPSLMTNGAPGSAGGQGNGPSGASTAPPKEFNSAPGVAKSAVSPTFRPSQSAANSILDGPAPGLKIPGALANESGTTTGDASAKRQATTPEPPPPGQAMGRLAPPLPVSDKQPRPGPAALSRVIGNRDFIVTLACYGEGVIVTPGGASFVWNDANDGMKTDEALVRAVIELVNRRQATVRAGEPPYRAVLRFEVHEQGRRTYHRVYPLLEYLRLPMVREDLEES